ncbi:MAG: hypothetical protein SH868_10375 [Bythopirellula sp.]|nr:hypothetical protein [Bythopirellula sp.]
MEPMSLDRHVQVLVTCGGNKMGFEFFDAEHALVSRAAYLQTNAQTNSLGMSREKCNIFSLGG